MSKQKERIGILVGGGPAPGINGVIGAASIEAINCGLEVMGIYEGFKWLAQGDKSHVKSLTYQDVDEDRFRGGSSLRTSRENPTKDPKKMENVLKVLRELRISKLVTIGGDDTAFSASTVAKRSRGAVQVAHVPKTIDNDLPLPMHMPTFGFQTARHIGGRLIKNLVQDARTTSRWYIVAAMGRSAGHLALGMGSAGGASLTLIPEAFPRKKFTVDMVCDIIEGSIVKAKILGQSSGVVIVAEGVGEVIKGIEDHPLVQVEHDDHGHLRLAEVPLGLILKRAVVQRFKERGKKLTFVDVTIGYELRCADPIPWDVEYGQQLGWGAVQYLQKKGTGALISIQAGKMVPIPFNKILDPKTGRTAVRRVKINSDQYRSELSRMTHLTAGDFKDESRVKKMAAVSGLTPKEFREKFSYLVK